MVSTTRGDCLFMAPAGDTYFVRGSSVTLTPVITDPEVYPQWGMMPAPIFEHFVVESTTLNHLSRKEIYAVHVTTYHRTRWWRRLERQATLILPAVHWNGSDWVTAADVDGNHLLMVGAGA